MRIETTALVLALCCARITFAAEPPAPVEARPELLRALDGRWVMKGDVMGEPVTYSLVAGPTLQGRFTELHMTDAQDPPQYEARVFIGVAPEDGAVIAHWLDSFGAKFSVPHGTGVITGNTVQFTIAYADGPFRDTLTYDPGERSWTLVIEASQPGGAWRHFARYDIRRD
jgi:hypothetical protein